MLALIHCVVTLLLLTSRYVLPTLCVFFWEQTQSQSHFCVFKSFYLQQTVNKQEIAHSKPLQTIQKETIYFVYIWLQLLPSRIYIRNRKHVCTSTLIGWRCVRHRRRWEISSARDLRGGRAQRLFFSSRVAHHADSRRTPRNTSGSQRSIDFVCNPAAKPSVSRLMGMYRKLLTWCHLSHVHMIVLEVLEKQKHTQWSETPSFGTVQ